VVTLGQVAKAVGQTGSAAKTMLTASGGVEVAAGELRQKVESFLRQVAV